MSSKDKRTGWWAKLKKGDVFYARNECEFDGTVRWTTHTVLRTTPTGRVVTAHITYKNTEGYSSHYPESEETIAYKEADERSEKAKEALRQIRDKANKLTRRTGPISVEVLDQLASMVLLVNRLAEKR